MASVAPPPWSIEPLASVHQRDSFSCGKTVLDEYLKLYALQNQKKNIGRTFVAVRPGLTEVKGYYTISSAGVAFFCLPDEVRKGLPRYSVPVVCMGRLAVALDVRRCGLGMLLLVDALRRTVRVASEMGVCGMEVHALGEEAKRFYVKYGFVELADDKLHLYLSMKVIQQLLSQRESELEQFAVKAQGDPITSIESIEQMDKSWRVGKARLTMKADQELQVLRSTYEGLSVEERAELRKWLIALSEVSAQTRYLPHEMSVLVQVDNTVYDQEGEAVGGGTASLSPRVVLRAIEAWDKGEQFTPGALETF